MKLLPNGELSATIKLDGNIVEWALENIETDQIKAFLDDHFDVWFSASKSGIRSYTFFNSQESEDIDLSGKFLVDFIKSQYKEEWGEDRDEILELYISALENDLEKLKSMRCGK